MRENKRANDSEGKRQVGRERCEEEREKKKCLKKKKGLKSRHRPEEGMSSSPCPLLAEEWNFPPLCANTSFLLQMTTFPLWN